MNSKENLLSKINEELHRWEQLIMLFKEEKATSEYIYDNITFKDVLIHIWAWQQVAIARLEAARQDKEPVFPEWVINISESEHDSDTANERIYRKYHRDSWEKVYRKWKAGYKEFISLANNVPEKDINNSQKYDWLKGYSLFDVLNRSDEHNIEHYRTVEKWLENKHKLKT